MNPAGTTTGVWLGLWGTLEVTDGVGSTAGVRVARLTTAIADATTINTAAMIKVTTPRRSHLPDGRMAGTGLAAAGAGFAVGGGGADSSPVSEVACGFGASCADRLRAAS